MRALAAFWIIGADEAIPCAVVDVDHERKSAAIVTRDRLMGEPLSELRIVDLQAIRVVTHETPYGEGPEAMLRFAEDRLPEELRT